MSWMVFYVEESMRQQQDEHARRAARGPGAFAPTPTRRRRTLPRLGRPRLRLPHLAGGRHGAAGQRPA